MHKTSVEKHFDSIAAEYNFYKTKNKFYYDNLKDLLASHIPKNNKVLEVGCGTGELLVKVNPSHGWGMDISSEMIKIANKKYYGLKNTTFSTQWPKGKYDYVFMCDVIEHLEDAKAVFKKISERMNKKSVFLMTMANPLWEPALMLGEWLGLKMPEGPHHRHATREIESMLADSKLKIREHGYRLLFPVKIPLVTKILNKYFEPYLRRLCFIEYFVVTKF